MLPWFCIITHPCSLHTSIISCALWLPRKWHLSGLSVLKRHPKLHYIYLHNVTHSLISQHPRERMFVVQISLLIVTFLSLITWNLSLMQTTQEVNPHPCVAPCVNMWSVFFFFSSSLCFLCFLRHLLNVGACVHHTAWEGQVEWTTLA